MHDKIDRFFFALLFLAIALNAGCGSLSREQTLYNGKNLENWELYCNDPQADPTQTWHIKGDILHCTGVPTGFIRTRQEYRDYYLHLEWRWAQQPGNSGILLHTTSEDKIWPTCIEAQLMADNAGDFWLIGGPDIDQRKAGGERVRGKRVVKMMPSNEKEPGQWNHYDIYCLDGTIKLYINGQLQNVATNATVQSGKIALQSEGKPIEFRNITIWPM